ncbi:MAG: L-glyceraldehyde 3-phosphate reductase [Bifidobacteriaceae bacterium]|jgi:L-glyceraldehyde 3-phosphate reductase|nr:L-glyceraldehyde 3-phosphate reductase [Bifidobacteriaceae bacterium]
MVYNPDVYAADPGRYDGRMIYRRCGQSGLVLPLITLGFWHNFGGDRALESQRAIARYAFDQGINHFDLANNYGPPYGSAELNFGRLLAQDFGPYRNELVISSKAGWDMWPGPYGFGGSLKYLTASLDNSLAAMGLEYVDIFYHHRADDTVPLEETARALDRAVRQGKALYVGISSYSPKRTAQMAAILQEMGTPLLIHQPNYSVFNRWIENGLLDTLQQVGAGCIAFAPLAQGLLTSRYLDGIPADSRAASDSSLSPYAVRELHDRIVRLNEIARSRGQSLAQLALAWAARDPRVTSLLIGASSVQQLAENLGALGNLDFAAEELAHIDQYALTSEVTNLWSEPQNIE